MAGQTGVARLTIAGHPATRKVGTENGTHTLCAMRRAVAVTHGTYLIGMALLAGSALAGSALAGSAASRR